MDTGDYINTGAALLVMPIAIGIIFAVVLQPRRTMINWLFAAFAMSVAVWAFGALVNGLDAPMVSDKHQFYLQLTGLALSTIIFSIFVTNFGDLQLITVKRMNAIGGVVGALIIVMLWDDRIIAWDDADPGAWGIRTTGYLVLAVGVSYLLAAYGLLRQRNTAQNRALQLPTLIIMSSILGNFLPLLSRLPYDLVTATLAVILLGRQVLQYQLFNPLEDLNRQLSAKNRDLEAINVALASEKQKVEQLNRNLQLANAYKNQFLANMSHELRTPLNSIIGYSDMLLQMVYGDINDKQRDRVDKIHKNGKSLLALINDILDLSKIEAGQMRLHADVIQVERMVEMVRSAVEPTVESKQLHFKVDISHPLPAVYADEMRLRQVVLNLVGNAVKFTTQGYVGLSILPIQVQNGTCAELDTLSPEMTDGNWLLIKVEDTGIGIAPENQERIFEEFQQADNSTTREFGGTGLGLSIAKHIVRMHRGCLWLTSTPGSGSQFYVALPVEKVEEAMTA